MLFKKNNLIVGLTTFHTELLRISVPALAQIKGKFLLVIHNDNPAVRLRPNDIRRLGYRGHLRIINSDENVGTLRARMAIISGTMGDNAGWIIFANDDDVLTDVAIPAVDNNIFAIIQNAVAARTRTADLMRGRVNFDDIDGTDMVLIRPNVGTVGTLIRTDIIRAAYHQMHAAATAFQEIDDSLDYIPPADAIMWHCVNAYVKRTRPDNTPIFMDKINYIKNALDTAAVKYGRCARPARNAHTQYAHALARYDAAFAAAANAAK